MMIFRRRQPRSYPNSSGAGPNELRFDFPMHYVDVIETHIPPGHRQPLHGHNTHYDSTWVGSGEIVVVEERDGSFEEATLQAGEAVQFEPHHRHTIRNDSGAVATMITFKVRPIPGMTPMEFFAQAKTDRYD